MNLTAFPKTLWSLPNLQLPSGISLLQPLSFYLASFFYLVKIILILTATNGFVTWLSFVSVYVTYTSIFGFWISSVKYDGMRTQG